MLRWHKGHFSSVAKVAIRFGCAKQSKNLKRYLLFMALGYQTVFFFWNREIRGTPQILYSTRSTYYSWHDAEQKKPQSRHEFMCNYTLIDGFFLRPSFWDEPLHFFHGALPKACTRATVPLEHLKIRGKVVIWWA